MTRLQWGLSVWRPRFYLIPPIVILTVLNAWLVVSIPLQVKSAFDSFGTANLHHAVRSLALLGLGRFAVYCTLQNCRAFVWSRLEWSVRSRVFARLVHLGPSFFGRYEVGDLVTRLMNDIGDDKLCWLLCPGLFRALEAALIIGAAALAMTHLSPLLAVVVLLPLGAVLVVFMWLSGVLNDRFQALQRVISEVTEHLQATFDGIRLVKAYQMECARQDALEEALDHRYRVEMETVRSQVLMEITWGYAWQIVAALVLGVGGLMVLNGRITIGDWVAFNGFAFSLTVPIFDIGSLIVRGRQAVACMDRVRELEDAAPDVVEQEQAASLLANGDPIGVHAEDVTFNYPSRAEELFRGLSFAISPGEFVALAGKTGCGKSTLLWLLVRLADPLGGTIRRDGHDLRTLKLDSARHDVGLVTQEAVVFSDTIAANVRCGRDIADEDIRRALSLARLEMDKDVFPQGIETAVGAKGTQLSGGQKQRLSLARAIAGQPRLLLLDDCTASLDAHTEEVLWEGLREALPRTTVVLVSHRAAALRRADRVLLIGGDGRLRASGSHAQLMDDAEYARLYRYDQRCQ